MCHGVLAFTQLCGCFWGLFGQKFLRLVPPSEVEPLMSHSAEQSPCLVRATMWQVLGELDGSDRRGQAGRDGYQKASRNNSASIKRV